MENLIELVTASLARHGVGRPNGIKPFEDTHTLETSAQAPAPIALLDHSLCKKLQDDPAP